MKSMTFMSACRDFFGMKPGQTPVQFGKEIKDLSEQDRAEIKQGLEGQGYQIIVAPGIQTVKEAALA
jgi:uncharacterized protein YcgL (UPF0745 family)